MKTLYRYELNFDRTIEFVKKKLGIKNMKKANTVSKNKFYHFY